MDTAEGYSDRTGHMKAKILNRLIAKTVDFIIIGALLEMIPRVGFFAGLTYLLIGDGLFDGRSLGKKIIKLKVIIHGSGHVCSFRESIIRNFPFAIGYILMKIPLIGFIFPLVVVIFEGLLILGNEKGMRLGDELAGTRVLEDIAADVKNEGGAEPNTAISHEDN